MKLIQQRKTRQQTLEFMLIKSMDTFSLNTQVVLEEGKQMLGITSTT